MNSFTRHSLIIFSLFLTCCGRNDNPSASPFATEVYVNPIKRSNFISIISNSECEIAEDGINLLGNYTEKEGVLRVVFSQNGAQMVRYFKKDKGSLFSQPRGTPYLGTVALAAYEESERKRIEAAERRKIEILEQKEREAAEVAKKAPTLLIGRWHETASRAQFSQTRELEFGNDGKWRLGRTGIFGQEIGGEWSLEHNTLVMAKYNGERHQIQQITDESYLMISDDGVLRKGVRSEPIETTKLRIRALTATNKIETHTFKDTSLDETCEIWDTEIRANDGRDIKIGFQNILRLRYQITNTGVPVLCFDLRAGVEPRDGYNCPFSTCSKMEEFAAKLNKAINDWKNLYRSVLPPVEFQGFESIAEPKLYTINKEKPAAERGVQKEEYIETVQDTAQVIELMYDERELHVKLDLVKKIGRWELVDRWNNRKVKAYGDIVIEEELKGVWGRALYWRYWNRLPNDTNPPVEPPTDNTKWGRSMLLMPPSSH